MRVVWSLKARRDLADIHRFIARDHESAAVRWVRRLQKRARDAADMPYSGRMVPEYGREDLREVLLKGYRIVYRVRVEQIEILVVYQGHRLLPDLDDI